MHYHSHMDIAEWNRWWEEADHTKREQLVTRELRNRKHSLDLSPEARATRDKFMREGVK